MALNTPVQICAAATALPASPASWAFVGAWSAARRPLEAVARLWSDAAAAFTVLELDGGIPQSFATAGVVAAKAFTVLDQPTGKLTATGHAYKQGDGPFLLTTTGALPAGLDTVTSYYVGVVDANTVQLYTSLEAAMSGGTPVTLTSAGSGTNSIAASTTSTQRLRWTRVELLGSAGDGAVSLSGVAAYQKRFRHITDIVAYALVGSVTSGNVSAAVSLEHPVS